MADVRVASVNGEWMNNWFTADADQPGSRQTFTIDGERGDTVEAATRPPG